ncbi:epoxide hydrolase [Biscogniauxia mediterranea]|nr:epoxide hydrolase [Biscogniauxia mediterranea]
MAVDPLKPNDSRVEHKFLEIGDVTYHYMLAKPEGQAVATAVLIHGWPDLGMGWRYQVPYLTSLGLQVIVPDMLGYGQTSAPEAFEEYTMKKMTAHIATLIKAETDQPVILGGHDWGGFFIWRMTMYYPELIRAVFSYCVPFTPPLPFVMTTEQLAERMPQFSYQIAFARGDVEAAVGKSPEKVLNFLNGIYGGRTPEGELIFAPEHGIYPERLSSVGPSPFVDPEMIAHYAKEFSRNGFRGPCNWYRTRELNGKDELPIAADYADFKFKVPAMIVMADLDSVLTPQLADGQEKYFAAGLKKELVEGASHWVMIQKPEESNKHLGDFLQTVLGDDLKKSASNL